MARKANEALDAMVATHGDVRVVLADYDLGLFTSSFIRLLRQMFEKHRNIPVFVYAGRRWKRFCELPGCYLIVDEDDLRHELHESSDSEIDEDIVLTDVVKTVVAQCPSLGALVAVGGACVEGAEWDYAPDIGMIRKLRIHKERLKSSEPKTPLGLRAVIASWMALKWKPDGDWICECLRDSQSLEFPLPRLVLYDRFDASNIPGLDGRAVRAGSEARAGGDGLTIPVANWDMSLDGQVIDLNRAKTCVPRYYTSDETLRDTVEDVVDYLKNEDGDWALYRPDGKPSLGMRLLWIQGPPRSGKTFLAQTLGQLFGGEMVEAEAVFASTELCSRLKDREMGNRLAGYIHGRRGKVAILDEFDKMVRGHEVQSALLKLLESQQPSKVDPSVNTILIVVTSTDKAGMFPDGKSTKKNVKDFYDRFRMVRIPGLESRACDYPYTVAQALLEKNVQKVCSAGFRALVGRRYGNITELRRELTAHHLVGNGLSAELGREAFVKTGFLPPCAAEDVKGGEWIYLVDDPQRVSASSRERLVR